MSARQYRQPLLQAIATGDVKKVKRLARLKRIDINQSEQISGEGNVTPLLLALTTTYPHNVKLRTQILQVLLSHPESNVNIDRYVIGKDSTDDIKKTCLLHIWIEEGELELIRTLVKHPKIDAKAVWYGVILAGTSEHLRKPTNKQLQNEIIKVLLSHPDISFDCYPDNTRTCLLRMFIENGELALVKSLFLKVEDVSPGIILAIEDEYLCNPVNKKVQNDIIKTLLEHPKIDVNVKADGADGDTALHSAVAKEQIKNVETLLKHPNIDVNDVNLKHPNIDINEVKEQIKTVETLLKHPNIDVNVLSTDLDLSYTYTPLDLSLSMNKTSRITKLLLDHPKIDVNKTDKGLRLPLSLPIRDKRSFECFEMLLNHKNIDVNAIDHELRQTPLACRALQKRYGHLLRGREAFPNSKYYLGKALKMLLNHRDIDLTIRDGAQRNILHHMVLSIEDSKDEAPYINMISEVLENNPDLITPDENGYTPIDFAKLLPNSFGLMDKVLDKYFQEIGKENIEAISLDREPSKGEDKKLKKDLNKCCWNCDTKDKKLYKCTGCKKAYYCSKDCITQDWPVHGGYCIKQTKIRSKTSENIS